MRAQRVIQYVAIYGVAVGLGAVVATSCISVDYPTVAFRCNPRQSENCPETHFCCSDDPAAVGGALPDYMGKNIGGATPIFSGVNNAIGTSGMCVRTSDLPAGSGLLDPGATNCPIPCNPTWSGDDITTVCGADRVCCQTAALEPTDCVIGDDDMWRPVTGADILSEPPKTNWAGGVHATHQDPNGDGCNTFAANAGIEPAQCYAELTVADQRGFCMFLQPGQQCPTDPATGFLDACTQINMMLIPPPVPGA
jgi:hypothetical protein